jgi:adenosylcobinamide-phosphate synthase
VLEILSVIFFAFLIDLLIGDPRYRYHPVRIIGSGVTLFSKGLRGNGLGGKGGGIILTLILMATTLALYVAISLAFRRLHHLCGLGFDLFICYSCLAIRDLITHTKPVIIALERKDLTKAREGISLVVGRDVRHLDAEGVSKAAMETLAENFVDGFLSPLFWYMVGGTAALLLGVSPVLPALCCMLAFKVASTLDSMVGYKNEEYLEFGWAGARLDDIMNFIPARISLAILFLGAWASGLNPMDGLKVALRDRLKHDSPNAAHAESFTAGIFHLRLGGPTLYPDGQEIKPWLGDGDVAPGPVQIRKMTSLVNRSAWISVLTAMGILFLAA